MKFKDWLDSKLIITDLTEKDLGRLGFSWSKTSLDVLKKIYNAYKHTGLLDLDEIIIYKNNNISKDQYYFAVNDIILNIDGLFSFIRQMNGNDILNKLDRESVKKYFLLLDNYQNDISNDENKYFFLLTLDPYEFSIDYIEKVESELNCITPYNTIDDMIDEFIELVKTNNYIKQIILFNCVHFVIMGFKSKAKLSEYIKAREATEEEEVIKIESEEDVKKFLNSLANISNANNDDSGNTTLLN